MESDWVGKGILAEARMAEWQATGDTRHLLEVPAVGPSMTSLEFLTGCSFVLAACNAMRTMEQQ